MENRRISVNKHDDVSCISFSHFQCVPTWDNRKQVLGIISQEKKEQTFIEQKKNQSKERNHLGRILIQITESHYFGLVVGAGWGGGDEGDSGGDGGSRMYNAEPQFQHAGQGTSGRLAVQQRNQRRVQLGGARPGQRLRSGTGLVFDLTGRKCGDKKHVSKAWQKYRNSKPPRCSLEDSSFLIGESQNKQTNKRCSKL